MYGIKVKTHFYQGTIGVPQKPFIVKKFPTREEAVRWLEESSLEQTDKNEWKPAGTYYLRHGEYARPTYSIVGCR